jgi:hypothetical protein
MRILGLASILILAPVLAAAQAPTPAAPRPPPPTPTNVRAATAMLAAAPKSQIDNGVLKATVLLPDKDKGFYRGVRFDWSGMLSSLKYGDQEYYGLWFDRVADNVRDFLFDKDEIIAATNTGAVGPAEVYDGEAPASWAEAPAGGGFLKIGVGVLRKPAAGGNYSQFNVYEPVNLGVWKVVTAKDRVEFTHTVTDPASGYGYVYRKVVRLVAGKPQMQIEHSLKNTGTKPISTTAYNHNFITFGGEPTGAGLTIKTPYAITTPQPVNADNATVAGGALTYTRALVGEQRFSASIEGYPPGAGPYDVAVHNAAGAGFHVVSATPMPKLALWSIRRTVAAEPYVTLQAAPGQTIAWTFTYTYAKGAAK